MNKRPGIPQIDPAIPKNIADVLRPLKEAVEIAQGVRSSGLNNPTYPGWKRRSVTLGMLIEVGLIDEAMARRLFEME